MARASVLQNEDREEILELKIEIAMLSKIWNPVESTPYGGVFIFKGKKKAANIADYYVNDDLGDNDNRHGVCEEIWETIHDRVQILQSNLNTQLFDDLLKYVQKAHKSQQTGNDLIYKEIPTAALVTGINSPDHSIMFQNLRSLLQETVTPFVAELHSKDCVNIRSTVSKAVAQLMGTNCVLEDEDILDEQPNLKRVSLTMSVLSQWYQDKIQGKSPKKSPKKRKSTGQVKPKIEASPKKVMKDLSSKPPVIFILEDLEAFSPHVLQDFITICSNHLDSLPVVLVFGVATSVTAVHRLLSSSSSNLLCMEKFQAPPSSDYLTMLIDQVVMTPDIPFKLGPKVFSLLLDIFLFHDFSVINFTRGLQFSLLDHFYSHPYSVLCHEYSEAKEILSSLSEKQLKHIRELPSFQAHLEERNKTLSPLKSGRDTKREMDVLLKKLHDYHQHFFPVMRCLHAFSSRLPKYPLGKQVRELYARCLSNPICDQQEYQESLLLMKNLSRDELVSLLYECSNNLQSDGESFKDINGQIEFYLGKFSNIDELQKEADRERVEAENEEVVIPKKVDMYTLRQTLQSMEMKKKKISVFEKLRNDMIDWLNNVFKEYLVPPKTLPLHEVFYYNNATGLRNHVSGSPRTTVQWALMDPNHYLQNENLKADGDNILPGLPDICIVYKLHLECGRLINLYDWLQAFMMIVSNADEESAGSPRKKKKQKEVSETTVLQARFIRAVSELQFLGFVKPTKRKTDHVARLTWGGC